MSKTDFEYIEERHFKGRFTVCNRRGGGHVTLSIRLANALKKDKIIILSAQKSRNTDSPDGSTWRTVKLLSAFKTADGKLCVIEIAPKENAND